MSQAHKHVLQRLFPIELGGTQGGDIEVEGASLDTAQARAEDLLLEMFPDKCVEMLSDWERVCGLTPGADDTLQIRRERVIRKLRERGGLSRAYFIALAASIGYTITIDELQPFRAGVNRCGDTLFTPGVIFIWRVNVSGSALTYSFRAGESAAGERLLWWSTEPELENLLRDLKPAHTYVIFNYL